MSGAGWLLGGVLLIAAIAGTDTPEQQEQQDPAVVGDWGFTETACDQHNRAFNVRPDTPEAWAAAQEWCDRSGQLIEQAPWPDGIHPTSIPT
ncbi:hypothetical protein JOF41_007345 [Saccharothrix coeruleofusca]|uniref:hypothetical protein n=1 Tax=Saccharothrix coeruleofusca TaxID=33919 RepID=UPI001AE4DFB2|nr:hypothetical protein [Saccharothrix coeruleofusca]MBP2341091.1 hypothetical protein [Saccharothrix coeruleofusca]